MSAEQPLLWIEEENFFGFGTHYTYKSGTILYDGAVIDDKASDQSRAGQNTYTPVFQEGYVPPYATTIKGWVIEYYDKALDRTDFMFLNSDQPAQPYFNKETSVWTKDITVGQYIVMLKMQPWPNPYNARRIYTVYE